jgi:DNA-binding NarL/FixJ family response regulator
MQIRFSISNTNSAGDAMHALDNAENALFHKGDDESRLVLDRIEFLLNHDEAFEDALLDTLIAHRKRVPGTGALIGSKIDLLSVRELEIAERIARGQRNREISQYLGITEGTVKVHLCRMYKRLGIGSRGELMLLLLGGSGEKARMEDDRRVL